MDAYIYQADIWCADCGNDIRTSLEIDGPMPPEGEECQDSERWPQGPYGDGGGEADTPQHCAHCHEFLENPLTPDGYAYVADLIEQFISDGRGDPKVLRQWAEFYGGENIELDRSIRKWKSVLGHRDWLPELATTWTRKWRLVDFNGTGFCEIQANDEHPERQNFDDFHALQVAREEARSGDKEAMEACDRHARDARTVATLRANQ